MTSKSRHQEAFVWVWLPGETAPVVAGRLALEGNMLIFNYGRTYLERKNAIALYEPELPLRKGALPLLTGLSMPGCLRDAAPDAWGRRVIINQKLGQSGAKTDTTELDELTYLLESGSDRIGALDFQKSANTYIPRQISAASLDELMRAAECIEEGAPLTDTLYTALLHGTSIGGARPKAMIDAGNEKYIAKFSSQGDFYSVVKAEFVAMKLAKAVGIDAAPVLIKRAAGKDVLLIQRFDRQRTENAWQRRVMVSALTILELDEMMARYASYEDLATIIRHRFERPKNDLRELFSRIVFNILCGNTDDHARNHAAFWDGKNLALTPAYDICPQGRSGRETGQAMLITGDKRLSQIAICLEAAPTFLLSEAEATSIAAGQIMTIRDRWDAVCEEAGLTSVDKQLFWRRQFLNPYALENAPATLKALVDLN